MEELVTYTTAKLAQEKGFSIPTQDKYQFINWEHPEIGIILNQGERRFGGVSNWNHSCFQDKYRQYVSAPTQSQLQKWLREVYNFNIEIKTPNGKRGVWLYEIHKVHGIGDYSKTNFAFQNYEQSLEAALEEALKLILLPSLAAGN